MKRTLVLTKAARMPAPQPTEPSAPPFYSNLHRVLDTKLPDKPVHPDFVRNLIKQHGISPDEQEFSGIHQVLDNHEGKIGRSDIFNSPKYQQPLIDESGFGKFPGASQPIQWKEHRGQPLISPGTRNNREILLRTTPLDHSQEYFGPHWTHPNVFAHIRMGDVKDASGMPVSHIDEIQSDWHQAGRKSGYKQPGDSGLSDILTRQAELRRDRAMRLHDLVRDPQWVEGIRGSDPELACNARILQHDSIADLMDPGTVRDHFYEWFGKHDPQLMDLHNQIGEAQRAAYDLQTKVPDAPFKGNWERLAFKRALRDAAERGHTRVTWTTGAQQHERYHPGHWFDRFEYDPQNEQLNAYPRGERSAHRLQVPRERIHEYIGPELASELMGKEPDDEGVHSIEVPEGVHMGGNGMKGFYDQILPRYAQELVKRHGGAVGQTQVQGGKPPPDPAIAAARTQLRAIHDRVSRGKGDNVYKHVGPDELDDLWHSEAAFLKKHGLEFPNWLRSMGIDAAKGDAQKWLDRVNGQFPGAYDQHLQELKEATSQPKPQAEHAPAHYMDISPRLREALLHEGIPMWGERNALQKALIIFSRLRKSLHQAVTQG